MTLESKIPRAETGYDEEGEFVVLKAGLLHEIKHGNARQRSRQGMKYSMLSARFSADGLFLATASSDKSVRVYHTFTGKELACIEHADWCRAVVFNPDGNRLATGCDDRTGRIWRWEAGEVVREFKHRLPVIAVDWSPNGQKLATVSKNQEVILHELVEVEEPRKLQHEDQVFSAKFSPNSLKIVTASGWDWGHALVWDVELAEILFSLQHYDWVLSVNWSPGGSKVLTTCRDKVVRIWDVTEYEDEEGNRHEGTECMDFEQSNWPSSAMFSPDGRRICVACDDGTARVIELETGWELICFEEEMALNEITYAPDARRICTASTGGTARIYGGLHTLQSPEEIVEEEATLDEEHRHKRATIFAGFNLFDPPREEEEEQEEEDEETKKAKEAEQRRRTLFGDDDD